MRVFLCAFLPIHTGASILASLGIGLSRVEIINRELSTNGSATVKYSSNDCRAQMEALRLFSMRDDGSLAT